RRSRGPCQVCPVPPLRRPAFLSRGSQRQHPDPEVSALPGSGKRPPRDVPDGGQLAPLAEDAPRRRAADRLRSPSAVAGATLTSGLGREPSTRGVGCLRVVSRRPTCRASSSRVGGLPSAGCYVLAAS